MQVLFIDVSQLQHSPAGDLLRKMMHGAFLSSVLNRDENHDEYSGGCYNGGVNNLYLRLSLVDLRAFLELVKETFEVRFPEGVEDFVSSVLAKVSTGNFRSIIR